MSHENVEVVRKWLALFIEVDEGLADPERLDEFLTQEGSFTFSGYLDDRRTFHSIDEFLRSCAGSAAPRHVGRRRWNDRRLQRRADRVVSGSSGCMGRPANMELRRLYGCDGRIRGYEFFWNHADALVAAGLRE